MSKKIEKEEKKSEKQIKKEETKKIENKTLKEKLKTFIKKPVTILSIIITILSLILICLLIPSKKGEIKMEAESTLKEITKTQNINTIEYTYNAVATKKTGKTVKYYVSYEGMVKAGVDFNAIEIKVDDENKTVKIVIPKPEITETTVYSKTFDYIFTKDKYKKEGMVDEVIELCEKDLKSRVTKDKLLLEAAEENAITQIKTFFQPWVEELDKDYEIEVVIAKEEK